MVRRYELTDEQWSQLAPLLPPGRQRTGRPSLDHRTVLNGILWIKRSGSAWRDLPERYGNWETVSSRFYRWQQQGLWTQLLARVQERADHASHVNCVSTHGICDARKLIETDANYLRLEARMVA